MTALFCTVSPHRWWVNASGPIPWTASTSQPAPVTGLSAESGQGRLSLTVDSYVGSNAALATAAVQMKEILWSLMQASFPHCDHNSLFNIGSMSSGTKAELLLEVMKGVMHSVFKGLKLHLVFKGLKFFCV